MIKSREIHRFIKNSIHPHVSPVGEAAAYGRAAAQCASLISNILYTGASFIPWDTEVTLQKMLILTTN